MWHLSSGVSDTQEVYALLMEIDKLLADIELKITRIQDDAPKTREAVISARTYFRLLSQINHILSHLGLPKEVDGAIAKLQKAIFVARALTIAMNAMAMGPVGILLGSLTVVGTMLSVSSPLEGY